MEGRGPLILARREKAKALQERGFTLEQVADGLNCSLDQIKYAVADPLTIKRKKLRQKLSYEHFINNIKQNLRRERHRIASGDERTKAQKIRDQSLLKLRDRNGAFTRSEDV